MIIITLGGFMINDFISVCSFCNGRGSVCIHDTGDDAIEPLYDTCSDCGGDGEHHFPDDFEA